MKKVIRLIAAMLLLGVCSTAVFADPGTGAGTGAGNGITTKP